jgi:hypothetical protein
LSPARHASPLSSIFRHKVTQISRRIVEKKKIRTAQLPGTEVEQFYEKKSFSEKSDSTVPLTERRMTVRRMTRRSMTERKKYPT